MTVQRLIIDTDPGIDDAAAIFFALGSPEVSVDLITTVFGNVEVDQATINAQRLLALAGRPDIRVCRGAAKPLRGAPTFAKHIHGNDGLGDLEWPDERAEFPPPGRGAVEAMIEHVGRHPGAVTIVALGPATNVALALALDPSLARQVRCIVCMGGAALTMGNASPVASANFYNDPWAAAIVYDSEAPIVQIGLDVCGNVCIASEQLQRLQQTGGRAAQRLVAMSHFIADAYQRVPAPVKRWSKYGAGPWVHFNDVPAIGYTVMPEVFTSERLPVVIQTDGIGRGQTVVDFRDQLGREANVDVCLGVDGVRLAEAFAQRVAALGRAARAPD